MGQDMCDSGNASGDYEDAFGQAYADLIDKSGLEITDIVADGNVVIGLAVMILCPADYDEFLAASDALQWRPAVRSALLAASGCHMPPRRRRVRSQ